MEGGTQQRVRQRCCWCKASTRLPVDEVGQQLLNRDRKGTAKLTFWRGRRWENANRGIEQQLRVTRQPPDREPAAQQPGQFSRAGSRLACGKQVIIVTGSSRHTECTSCRWAGRAQQGQQGQQGTAGTASAAAQGSSGAASTTPVQSMQLSAPGKRKPQECT